MQHHDHLALAVDNEFIARTRASGAKSISMHLQYDPPVPERRCYVIWFSSLPTVENGGGIARRVFNTYIGAREWIESNFPDLPVHDCGTLPPPASTQPHQSDCTVHNEPAYPNGPCDCAASLRSKIAEAINSVSAENGSNTPDFILAEYVTDCLAAYDKALTAREKWYGREPKPVRTQAGPPPPMGFITNAPVPDGERCYPPPTPTAASAGITI